MAKATQKSLLKQTAIIIEYKYMHQTPFIQELAIS